MEAMNRDGWLDRVRTTPSLSIVVAVLLPTGTGSAGTAGIAASGLRTSPADTR